MFDSISYGLILLSMVSVMLYFVIDFGVSMPTAFIWTMMMSLKAGGMNDNVHPRGR